MTEEERAATTLELVQPPEPEPEEVPGMPADAVVMLHHQQLGSVPVTAFRNRGTGEISPADPKRLGDIIDAIRAAKEAGEGFTIYDHLGAQVPMFHFFPWKLELIQSVGIAWDEEKTPPSTLVVPAVRNGQKGYDPGRGRR